MLLPLVYSFVNLSKIVFWSFQATFSYAKETRCQVCSIFLGAFPPFRPPPGDPSLSAVSNVSCISHVVCLGEDLQGHPAKGSWPRSFPLLLSSAPLPSFLSLLIPPALNSPQAPGSPLAPSTHPHSLGSLAGLTALHP